MKQFEETAGKLAMVVAFSLLLAKELVTIRAMVANTNDVPFWGLALAGRVASLAFLVLVLYLTVTRLPPRTAASGLEPRVTAIGGTFLLMLLVVLPPSSAGPGLRLLSTLLIIVGTSLSVYCLYFLGRSFSIMATARRLVTHGPFGVVRHPLYLAEGVSVIGIVLANWSVGALAIGVAQFALQFRRMHHEERVLRAAFPEYAAYAARVPMFVPRLRAARPPHVPERAI